MKKFNKILSLLMAFAMVLTMLPTPAMAVVNKAPKKNDSQYIQGLPLGDRELMESVRENAPEKAGTGNVVVSETNGMIVTETQNPGVTMNQGNAAEQLVARFEQDEIVRVIVVLEGEPLLDQGFTTDEIAANNGEVAHQVSVMHKVQDALMGDINVLVQNLMPDAYTGKIEAKYNYSITMNGMAVEVPFGVVDEIAELNGVETAYVAPQYNIPEDMTGTADPAMVTTQKLAGSALAWELGYTGAGMRIAIIDTGLDTDHPSFVGDVPTTNTSLTVEEIAGILNTLNAYKQYDGLKAKDLYISTKIPYHFNYVDEDLDVTHDHDSAGDHGTHVAGIAAANKINTTDVVGVAPEAQIIAMKVFGKNGGAYWDDIVAALEDCLRLNVDAINMSLGSPSGFTWETDKLSVEFQTIMQRIANTDIIASVSAGNSYSAGTSNYWYEFMMAYGLQSYFPELVPGHNQTIDPANGVVSSPATFIGATVVASLENDTTAAEVLVAKNENGGEDFVFVFGDNYTYFTYYLAGYFDDQNRVPYQNHEYDYVMVPGLGTPEDFAKVDVKGKIAVVQRGDIAFTDKQINAANAGAVGCIVYDNVDADLFYMQDAGALPNISITLADGLKLKELAGADGIGTLVVRYNHVVIADNALAGTMSDFSSWGVTPDLRLVPDVTSYGGNIYSTYTNGEYGIMSGTSMSAPHIAGMSALVLQYLRDSGFHVLTNEADYHMVAEALLMSTAEPVVEPSGILYSPRKQGAGNANVYNALQSPVYLTVNGGKPSVSFGEDEDRTGKYTFGFELNNLTGEAQTYVLDASVLTDQFHEGFYELVGIKLMGETSRELDAAVTFESFNTSEAYFDYNGNGIMNLDDVQAFLNDTNHGAVEGNEYDLNGDGKVDTADVQALYNMVAAVSSSKINSVTVPAYGTTKVSVTITLTADDMAYMDANYPNGIYVEGFVRAYAENSDYCDLSLPFMGFYGDWSDARVFDTYSWYHEGMELPERYASILWVDSATGIAAGGNPYEGPLSRFDETYEPEYYLPVVSPNGDGANDYIDDMYLSLMRNAKRIEFVWSDEDGNILDTKVAEYARQSSYQSGYGSIVPFVYSWYYEDVYDFAGLENGTEVTLDLYFYLDDGDDKCDDYTSATILVDTEYPTAKGFEFKYDEKTNERKIVFTVSDDRDIAAVGLLTRMGSIVDMLKPTSRNAVKNADGSYTVTFDVTDMDNEFVVVVGDYGGNEIFFNVEFADGTDHVRKDAFYGYRNVYKYIQDNKIYMMTNYNGWHSFETPSAMLMHTSYYSDVETAVVAAEYVDGYIIAIDEYNEIFAMKAGDWTRIPVGTFELEGPYYAGPVLDMAYDIKNNVMYVLTDEKYVGYGGCLATIDLLTGEVAGLATIQMPEEHEGQILTLACDNDGILYGISYVNGAVKGNKDTGDLYILNPEKIVAAEEWYDADTLPVDYVGETGYVPDYRQSMTVDHETNELYWMAYTGAAGNYTANFFRVDKKNGDLTEVDTVDGDSWMTAVFKPYTKGKDVLPAAELEAINLDITSIVMSAGSKQALTATPAPYYADLGDITWTTSDKAVATVDENGVVTTHGAGRAIISAISADGSVSASCIIDIVELTEDLTFFDMNNYYIWEQINAANAENVTYREETMNYAGIAAAAYFNGKVYATDAMGDFYCYDAKTLMGNKIGTTGTMLFAMAFNYDDGFMYGIEGSGNAMMGMEYYLVRINLNNGLIERLHFFEDYANIYGMAIDYDGNFYMVGTDYYTYSGSLLHFTVEADEVVIEKQYDMSAYAVSGYGSAVYSEKDNGVFVADANGKLLWIDLDTIGTDDLRVVTVGYMGDPANYEIGAMNMGMFVVPEKEPELPYVKPTKVIIPESYLLLVGVGTAASVVVEPWNSYPEITYAIADSKIASVDASGNLMGLSAGKTTLIVTVDGVVYERPVEVRKSAGTLYGSLLADIYSSAGDLFIRFTDADPAFIDLASDNIYEKFSVYSGAYFDGKLYGFAQDATYDGDLGYMYYFLTFDADTYEYTVGQMIHYTLRDWAMDYTTGNMYAIASGDGNVGAVAQVDLETGDITIIADTGIRFAAMTIDNNGQMYGISEDDNLYAIDKYTGAIAKIGHTGVDCGAVFQSMHYDWNTGNVYWTQMADDQTSSLRLVDLETGSTTSLGMISEMGAMVGMLYTIPENERTEPDGEEVATGIKLPERTTTYVGGTVQLNATVLDDVELVTPDASASAEGGKAQDIIWVSSDTSIATVDKNGLVKGVSAGVVTITAKIGDHMAECVVTITEHERKFYAYDKTNNQWISFEADDTENVKVVRKDAEGEAAIHVSAYTGTVVYAYDANNNFYRIDADTFVRTTIGAGVSDYKYVITQTDYFGDTYDVECTLYPVGMAYDNGKLYGAFYAIDEYAYVVTNLVCEIDMTTGGIKEILLDTSEVCFNGMWVKDGVAYTIDTFYSDILTAVDLYADEVFFERIAVMKGYWGNVESSVAYYIDELTGDVYAVRDMTKVDGYGVDYDGDGWYDEWFDWDFKTGEGVLNKVILGDGYREVIGEIGDNLLIRGLFLR